MEYLKLLNGDELSTEETHALFQRMISSQLMPAQIAAVLGVIAARGPRLTEIIGARDAVRSTCILPERNIPDAFDVCGTGGDGKSTFNISTCTAFVLAGAGKKVVKNGSYGATSKSGSSNVLEELKVKTLDDNADIESRLSSESPIFIHAPVFYPTLRALAPIRKELGIRTIFNLLGPLLNPVQVGIQLVGVPDRDVLRTYGEVLRKGKRKYAVVCSLDGYDEVSLTAPAQVISHRGIFQFSPSDFGFSPVHPDEISLVGGADESAKILRDVLSNRGSEAKTAVVVSNAALALWCDNKDGSLGECISLARKSIESGSALKALEDTITF